MCKKNLNKQNVVEELSWGGGGGDFRKSTKTPNTEKEGEKRRKGGGERLSEKSTKTPNTEREEKKKWRATKCPKRLEPVRRKSWLDESLTPPPPAPP